MSMKGTLETWVWFPGLGRSPGEGNGNPLQYSCLENPMDRGTWWATVHGVVKSQTWLSNWACTHTHTFNNPSQRLWASLLTQMGKECACNAGDPGSVPAFGRSPGEGNGNPPEYSCLENSMDRGTWQYTVHRVRKSWTWLSDYHFHFPKDFRISGLNSIAGCTSWWSLVFLSGTLSHIDYDYLFLEVGRE